MWNRRMRKEFSSSPRRLQSKSQPSGEYPTGSVIFTLLPVVRVGMARVGPLGRVGIEIELWSRIFHIQQLSSPSLPTR
ncbi:hypothetical protein RSAG8_07814, partial [Rhizoctonia solani AG-8 WAC10335]